MRLAQITDMESVDNSPKCCAWGDLNFRDAAHFGTNHRNASAHGFPIFRNLPWWGPSRQTPYRQRDATPLAPRRAKPCFSKPRFSREFPHPLRCAPWTRSGSQTAWFPRALSLLMEGLQSCLCRSRSELPWQPGSAQLRGWRFTPLIKGADCPKPLVLKCFFHPPTPLIKGVTTHTP